MDTNSSEKAHITDKKLDEKHEYTICIFFHTVERLTLSG